MIFWPATARSCSFMPLADNRSRYCLHHTCGRNMSSTDHSNPMEYDSNAIDHFCWPSTINSPVRTKMCPEVRLRSKMNDSNQSSFDSTLHVVHCDCGLALSSAYTDQRNETKHALQATKAQKSCMATKPIFCLENARTRFAHTFVASNVWYESTTDEIDSCLVLKDGLLASSCCSEPRLVWSNHRGFI